MKAAITTLLLLYVATAAAQGVSREKLVAEALEEYGKVAGAWFLNVRCRSLVEAAVQAFEEDVATINIQLGRDVGNPRILFRIQLAARELSNSSEYGGCGDRSQQIVEWGVGHAQRWSGQIDKIREESGG